MPKSTDEKHHRMKNPVLSIGISTYNQAPFIHRAITSVLSQKTSYEHEIIISDDASTDDTESIVKTFTAQHPKLIKYIRNANRQGPSSNARILLNEAKGRYYCWLDADDYWCYDKKIQTQLDFLEQNPSYTGCFHDAQIISSIDLTADTQNQLQVQKHGHWKSYSQFNTYTTDFFPWDVLQRKIIPTASLVFRKIDVKQFFKNFEGIQLSLSWALQLEIIKDSKFRYFNEMWSVYNDHAEGFSKSVDLLTFKLNNIDILIRLLDDDYYKLIRKDVFKAIANEYFYLLHCNEAKQKGKKEYYAWCNAYQAWMKKALKADIVSFKKEIQ